jgi:hypothetical protein
LALLELIDDTELLAANKIPDLGELVTNASGLTVLVGGRLADIDEIAMG